MKIQSTLNLKRLLEELSAQLQFDLNASWESLDTRIQNIILFGDRQQKFKLSPFFSWNKSPTKLAQTFDGLIKIYQEKSKAREKYGIKTKCELLRPIRPWERIQLIVEENQKSGVIPFLLTDFSATLRFTRI